MKLGEIIKQYREEHNISQRQFALQCNVSNGYISMLEKGVNPKTDEPIVPSITTLKVIASTMGMTLNELMNISDDMEISLSDSKLGLKPVKHSDKRIPLVGTIACGEPIIAVENRERMVECPEDIDADFCLRAKGDSMIDARICNGDIVFIRKQPDVDDGQIAAVRIGDEATLKRVFRTNGTLLLMPCNHAYSPIIPSSDDDIEIIGLAVAFLSNVD